MWQSDLAKVEKDVRSDDPNVRNTAMLELCRRARKDPKVGALELRIFRDAVEHPRDGWTTANAISGIELALGRDDARRIRIPFFDHPDVDIACPAIITSPDAGCVPALIDVLGRRTEPKVRIAILQTFARLRDARTLEPMLSCLAHPEERPYAIEALGSLGDPRAVPALQQHRADPTPTWPLDDRGGPMMTVGDMAGYAIGRIDFHTRRPAPMTPASTFAAPVAHATTIPSRKWGVVLTFVPLAAALFLIPWVFVIVILSLDNQGHLTTTPRRTHALDLVSALPALAGLLAGAYVVIRCRPLQVWQWIVVTIGSAACMLATFSFGWEFLH